MQCRRRERLRPGTNRREAALLIAIAVAAVGCGGGDDEEGADPVAGTAAVTSEGSDTTVAADQTAATAVPDATPPETAASPDPSPAATTAPDELSADAASELPDPCGLVTPQEIAAFVEPGTVGAELDADLVVHDRTRLRQCDWPGNDRGLSIQLQRYPDLSTVTMTADGVAPIEGLGMEATTVLADDGETVVMVAFDTGDIQLILFPWERTTNGSPQVDALVDLGVLVGDRI